MFRTPCRVASAAGLVRRSIQPSTSRRCLSTAPPHKQSRSWKSSFARWGIAGGIVYYYNTSNIFADEPTYTVHIPLEAPQDISIKQVPASSGDDRSARLSEPLKPTATPETATAPSSTPTPDSESSPIESPEALEEEASQQGAFNEETGEINWDCPCLGGMAYGPCGEQFRTAFSCFVFSKEDPKGVECIDHFKAMQNCFREHPEIYGSELEEDEVAEGIEEQSHTNATTTTSATKPVANEKGVEQTS